MSFSLSQLPDSPDWLSEEGLKTLQRGYLVEGEVPRTMYERIARAGCNYLKRPDLFEDFFRILWNGWLGPATPVASNFGVDRKHNRGLPISCFGFSIGDTLDDIYLHLWEQARMSNGGGGVGAFYGRIREAGSPISGGGISNGIVPWALQYDRCAATVTQGNTRRGAMAHYLPIEHPDALELLLAKDHLEGDPRQMVDGNIAFTVTDKFLEKVLNNDPYCKKVWAKALECNVKFGSPYFIFIDTVNRMNPDAYKMNNLIVETSNLCSEITLFTDEEHSFICCLSSLNLHKWFEWKDWIGKSDMGVVELSIYLLDAVLSEFIERASDIITTTDGVQVRPLYRAVSSAVKGRALGLGVMGLHHLYQSLNLPFKCQKARDLNLEIHSTINERAKLASIQMAREYGQPEWCLGTPYRHTHRTAIAPTRTNSVITNAFSPGIEPTDNNSYVAKQAKGSFTRKNPLLVKLLDGYGLNTPEVWDSIVHKNGSIMHLEELTIDEIMVFLTAREIDPYELVIQAIARAPHVDQAQSLNRFVHPNIPIRKLNDLVMLTWKHGVKSSYYTKSTNTKLLRKVQHDAFIITKDDCSYCKKAKDLMKSLGINYREFKHEDCTYYPWKTVPYIWYQGHAIGGFNDFEEMLEVEHMQSNPTKTRPVKDVPFEEEEELYVECSSCGG